MELLVNHPHAELPHPLLRMTATTMVTNTRLTTSWTSTQVTSLSPSSFATRKSTTTATITTTVPSKSPAAMPCHHDTQDPPPRQPTARKPRCGATQSRHARPCRLQHGMQVPATTDEDDQATSTP
ncbi:hypothetical protein EDB83DRAFT_2532241 [Lactarius deliciosus]|nr:hypothetical protein EDB83DRAFT_2532241 [Lactarius deliciosus]